ncbi:MAG: aquaporin [Ferruginibacter sp.]
MKKLITEFIGTFFLILTIGLVVVGGKGDFAPVAIGSALMVMIFAGAHVSGAHYNPAVTVAVLIRGRINISDAIGYWVAQIVGAVAAAYTVMFLLHDKMPAAATAMTDTTRALVAEIVGTFALCYVVLNVATAKGTVGNMFYGLAIGFTVLAMAYALGGISGGAFNPAVGIGVCFMKLADWSNIWVYLVGCFGGAVIAAIVFKVINADDI